MPRLSGALFATAAFLVLASTRPVAATTIHPLSLEELVARADLVGVVECETAGGIVARYRVVESWKGPAAGKRVTIRVAVNYWEPQFPIALCGQRYFVTAYKGEPPSNVVTSSVGGGVPLWWRDIPADYRLPLFQGRRLLEPGEEKGKSFGQFRDRVRGLLALKPAEREAALLKALIRQDLFSDKWVGGEPDAAKVKALRRKLDGLKSADALVAELLRLARADPKKWAVRVRIVLHAGGGAVTLAALDKLPADPSPWEAEELEGTRRALRSRLGQGTVRPHDADEERPAPPRPPTAAELARLKDAVSGKPDSREFFEAFDTLTRFDPGPAAAFLVRWQSDPEEWRTQDLGYVLGSYYGWKCGKDRVRHLRTLLTAKDPHVRVAGAVYLCFEDRADGTAALRKLTALKGDPGVWAALALARRGDKGAVPRALQVFAKPRADEEARLHRTGMSGVPHGNLQKRVLVLLSNSAHAGGVPQPPLAGEEGARFDELVRWWDRQKDKVALRDPWLETLDKQKID
jgi:hypothetical protein